MMWIFSRIFFASLEVADQYDKFIRYSLDYGFANLNVVSIKSNNI